MTRAKEIMKEAEKVASANTQSIGDWSAHFLGFIHGAEWADRTMLDKACDWLEEFMQMTPSKKTFIKRFKQAMKGE